MFWFGLFTLTLCLWLIARNRRQPVDARNKKGNAVDWLLTGGLAVFLLLVFRLGWAQALLRLQYWVWALLPFLRRGDTQAHFRPAAEPPGALTRAEAARILGVEETASEIEIQKAYRGLMQKLHPDAGGNSYLAGKLNEARDRLLENR